jgi:pimeloyl-ACP methyl ester carboxylesterase
MTRISAFTDRFMALMAGGCGALPLLILLGCAADIDKQQPAPSSVQAVFEPSLSILPTPNDLARNAQTGLLQVPVADVEDLPAQAAFDTYLNSLDGFPVSSTATLCLSGQVDAESLSGAIKAVKLPQRAGGAPTDVSSALSVGVPSLSATCPVVTTTPCNPTAEEPGCGEDQRCLPASSKVPSIGVCAERGYLVTVSHTEMWDRDATYVLLLSRAAVDVDGRPVIRSANFELAAGRRELCAVDPERGACTFNYSALLASSVEGQVEAEAEAQDSELSEEELERVIHAEVLSTATSFEQLRQATDRLLQAGAAAGLERDDIVLAWAFSTTSQTEAVFDPASSQIPGPPNELVMQEGQVSLPASPDETDSERALRLALNTLDGFSTTAMQFTGVIGGLDASTVTAGAELMLVELSEQPSMVDPAPVFAHDAGNSLITMQPSAPLKEQTRYAVLMLSKRKTTPIERPDGSMVEALTDESGGGLADDEGRRVIPSPTFALVRGASPLVDGEGRATVSVLSDEQAALLEPIRQGYDQLLGGLEQAEILEREDVVLLWTFKTQSITEPLVTVRAGAYGQLLAAENEGGAGEPTPQPLMINDPSKNFAPETCHPTCWPTPAAPEAIELFVAGGAFSSWNALDASSDLLAADLSGEPETVPLWLTIPKATPCAAQDACPTGFTCSSAEPKVCQPDEGWPVVVFQHGLGASRVQFFAVADTLAKFGFAAAAFDVVYHGDRSACSSDDQCENPVEGGPEAYCDTAALPRRCCVGEGESKACDPGLFKTDENGIPLASAEKFLNVANPFALKSNMLQHVIDSVALLRALRFDGELGLRASDTASLGIELDENRVYYATHSLGAILGVLVMAVDPLHQGQGDRRVFLNVPGAPVVQIFQDSPSERFQAVVGAALAGLGIEPGTRDALQLFHVLQWVLDPVDPANFASYLTQQQLPDPLTGAAVPAKQLLMQVASNDTTIPAARQLALAQWLGADVSRSTYDTTNHIFLLRPGSDEPADLLLLTAAQLQMGTFLATGAVCTPDLGDAANPCKVEGGDQ